jgi:uncharacterized protein YprB with RNaseH-like and TPR domain
MAMDLKKRLAQFDRLSQLQPGQTAAGDTAPDPERLAAICRELGLGPRATEDGALWSRDYDPLPEPAPPANLPDFREIFTRSAPSGLKPGGLLFLDTETTGLAGGTGSLAFLIGLAWWGRTGLRVRQLFLPGPGREGAMLGGLAELAERFQVVVTFNGNSFDLPLLRTRCLLARRPDPLAPLASWDLLPAVRRLWGRWLPDCRQQTSEQRICGYGRGPGDIDGSRIPQVFFQYLRQGETELLPAVLRHNRRDMVGMAHLLAAVADRARTLTGPKSPTESGQATRWQDAWSNSRILEARRDSDRSAAWMREALVGLEQIGWEDPDGPPENFGSDAVRILKRVRAWSLVERVLQQGLRRWGDRPWLHREAAILYEHRLHRLEEAMAHARRLGEPVRLRRLTAKLAGASGPAAGRD